MIYTKTREAGRITSVTLNGKAAKGAMEEKLPFMTNNADDSTRDTGMFAN